MVETAAPPLSHCSFDDPSPSVHRQLRSDAAMTGPSTRYPSPVHQGACASPVIGSEQQRSSAEQILLPRSYSDQLIRDPWQRLLIRFPSRKEHVGFALCSTNLHILVIIAVYIHVVCIKYNYARPLIWPSPGQSQPAFCDRGPDTNTGLLLADCTPPKNRVLSFLYSSFTSERCGGGAMMAGVAGIEPAAFFFASAIAAR